MLPPFHRDWAPPWDLGWTCFTLGKGDFCSDFTPQYFSWRWGSWGLYLFLTLSSWLFRSNGCTLGWKGERADDVDYKLKIFFFFVVFFSSLEHWINEHLCAISLVPHHARQWMPVFMFCFQFISFDLVWLLLLLFNLSYLIFLHLFSFAFTVC